jgi:Chaperone of endosialidase
MNRFNLRYKLLVITVIAFFVWAIAADIPFTFKPGDLISADQMNQNFAALNNGKQELVKGSCAAGSSIRVIAADGSVSCEVDDIGSGGTSGVDAINGMTGAVTLQSGDNIALDDSQPGQIRISSSAGNSYAADGASLTLNATTFSVKDGGISTVKLADSAVTPPKLAWPLITSGAYGGFGFSVQNTTSPGAAVGVRGQGGNSANLNITGPVGVLGESQSGIGIYGASTSDIGVRGKSISGNGVYGESMSSDAVVGVSTSSGHAGIVGANKSGGFAAYFEAGTAVCSFKSGTTGWACSSDRNLKENFEAVNSRQILESVVTLPVTTWSIKGSTSRQMGPTAQDFYAAFDLGDNDKTINNTDAQGVAFAAIQGLYQLVQEQQTKIEELERELATLQNN